MIRVIYERSPEAQGLLLTGHATGSEVVCAAASALVCTLAVWLEEHKAAHGACSLKPGNTWLLARRGRLTDGAFAMTLAGLARLGREYPEQVRVLHGEIQKEEEHEPAIL